MFNLIPWKKQSDGGVIKVRHPEPSRQDLTTHPLSSFREEVETLLSRFFDDPWWGSRQGGWHDLWESPRFDLSLDLGLEENDKEYVVQAELPGFEKGDFDVKVSGNRLTIHAEHQEENEGKRGRRGYRLGSFSRTFMLPHGVDDERIDARYHSGVLEVRLPKTEEAQGRRIPINTN